jgi:hypothetical protein
MKKIHLILLIGVALFFSCQKEQSSSPIIHSNGYAQDIGSVITRQTLPITAVSFPREVITVEGGRIEFWAKLIGYDGKITVGGYDPHFFQVYDGTSTFHMGFNSNDGAANGGLIGMAGCSFACGTGTFGNWTYEMVYGAGNVNKWHHYVYEWNKNGIKCLNNPNKKIAIYVDGILNTHSWHAINQQKFLPLTAGVLNLITNGGYQNGVPGQVIMDELKIYNNENKLILWNTLGSVYEVTHSKVGLNGSFNGGGNASFVTGVVGNALIAEPVDGLGDQ